MQYKFMVMVYDHILNHWRKEVRTETRFADVEEAKEYALVNGVQYLGCTTIYQLTMSAEDDSTGHKGLEIGNPGSQRTGDD